MVNEILTLLNLSRSPVVSRSPRAKCVLGGAAGATVVPVKSGEARPGAATTYALESHGFFSIWVCSAKPSRCAAGLRLAAGRPVKYREKTGPIARGRLYYFYVDGGALARLRTMALAALPAAIDIVVG
jgi:hypothetical protein